MSVCLSGGVNIAVGVEILTAVFKKPSWLCIMLQFSEWRSV
jgi:hypothetical protein